MHAPEMLFLRFGGFHDSPHPCDNPLPARVVELVYTADLKSAAARLTGSSPVLGTMLILLENMKFFNVFCIILNMTAYGNVSVTSRFTSAA